MTYTKGNVIVEDIHLGDIHYEYAYGVGIKSEVISLPQRDDEGYWTWMSKNCNKGNSIIYEIREGMSHYSPNLYDYEAYQVKHYI